MSGPGVLVAGVGNIFLGDDGFGCEVARRLAASPPPGAKVVDFGIRGLHLAFELLEGYATLVLVDTVERGDPPGTITVLEVEAASEGGGIPDAHDMGPQNVLDLLADFGGRLDRVLVVGCEAATVEEGIGLSGPVDAAVPEAVRVVEDLVREEIAAYAGKER
ncbi:MAG: hydrogenase maturation protease [Actinomycetota bacterium]